MCARRKASSSAVTMVFSALFGRDINRGVQLLLFYCFTMYVLAYVFVRSVCGLFQERLEIRLAGANRILVITLQSIKISTSTIRNKMVQLLQQQVTVLADTQNTADDRYARVKAENAVLQARVHMLEEQLRDMELRCEERIAEEQRRGREAITRVERDRDSQIENLNNRLAGAETEAGNLRQEAGRLRGVSEGLRLGVDAESQRLREAQDSVATLTVELQKTKEALRKEKETHEIDAHDLNETQKELEKTRAELAARGTMQGDSVDGTWGQPDLLRLEELHEDLNRLRQENKNLSEAHEELQAQMLTRGLETGRSLLGPPLHSSLAAELTEMTNDQFGDFSQDPYTSQYEKMQKALKEQQDVNSQLRSYIDGMLLQIVENYPQLLEVKATSKSLT